MCGIVGFTGRRDGITLLLDALQRLEYRGYDSAGVALLANGTVQIEKAEGKLGRLREQLQGKHLQGYIGIGHTRWATHGRPSDLNAHPHTDCEGRIAVAHNGIIENFSELRDRLKAEGHRFTSDTDTETIAHLIESKDRGDFAAAVREAVNELEGSFALAIIHRDHPQTLVAVRQDSPLLVGLGKDENFLASDTTALLPYTRRYQILKNRELAVLTPESVRVEDFDGNAVVKEVFESDWDMVMAEKGGFKHFMLKEINEQPRVLRESLRGRLRAGASTVDFSEITLDPETIRQCTRVVIIACGTAYHAGLVGKYLLESWARLPVEIDVASELRYRDPVVDDRTIGIVISQSGETADTLSAMRLVGERGATLIGITNVLGSSVAREVDAPIFTYAGPEIAVASTKAYTTQLAVLTLLAIHFGQVRGTLPVTEAAALLDALRHIPDLVEITLSSSEAIREIAEKYADRRDLLFLGRGVNYPSALEGALKLKEISYQHAEGYAAGEMKHGPIALVTGDCPTIVVAPKGKTYDKIISNIEQVRARGGEVIAIGFEGDTLLPRLADQVISIPECPEMLSPILAAIPLQLFAYHCADLNHRDVDQPRNLAKSVTVE